jgi:hypothetical protein
MSRSLRKQINIHIALRPVAATNIQHAKGRSQEIRERAQRPLGQMSTQHASMHLSHKPATLHVKHEKDILSNTAFIPETDSSLKDPTLNQSAAEASENPAAQDLVGNHAARKIPDLLSLIHETADKPVLVFMSWHNALSDIDAKRVELLKAVRRNFNVRLDQKKIIETFTDAFIDKQVLRLNYARQIESIHCRSNVYLKRDIGNI